MSYISGQESLISRHTEIKTTEVTKEKERRNDGKERKLSVKRKKGCHLLASSRSRDDPAMISMERKINGVAEEN